MKRKVIYGMMIAALLSSILPGCGDFQDDKAESKEEATLTGGKDLYGYEEPITLKVGLSYALDFVWAGEENPENNSWMDLYREHNIYPEILYNVDISQADSKLSTAMISGNYPDIFQASTSDYLNYVGEGVVADITEAYEKYASDQLKEYMMSDGGEALRILTVDGKLYGLPRLGNPYEECSIMFIRQDWLDNLNLEVPETMDELKEAAHAFTYGDPDGNGVDDTYGIAMNGIDLFSDTIGDSNPIFNAFGAYFGSDGMALIENEDGEIVWGGANGEGMKSALTLLQELYQDGSLTNDFLTMDGDAIFEEAGTGRCGIWFGPSWAGMIPAVNAAMLDKNAHVVAVPLPDGGGSEDGKAYLSHSIKEIHCISSKCENPEALVKMMNLSVQKICNPKDEEEYRKYNGDNVQYTGWKASLLQLQPYDKGSENWKAESRALKTGESDGLNLSQHAEVGYMREYLQAMEEGRVDPEDKGQYMGITMYTLYGDPQSAWAVISEMMEKDDFIKSANSTLPSSEVTEVAGTLKNLTTETIIKIITGDPVENYDSFLDTWYALGGQKAVRDANDQKKEAAVQE